MTDLSAARRLVKSPPELWAEISDPEALARHLGEFGEIRITRVEPEHTVAWEGDLASGVARIESSGWGTKVVLTARLPDPEPEAVEQPAQGSVDADAGLAEAEADLAAAETELARAKTALADRESRLADAAATLSRAKAALAELGRPDPPEPATVPPAEDHEPEAELEVEVPRPGFFARLFGSRHEAEEAERRARAERWAEAHQPASAAGKAEAEQRAEASRRAKAEAEGRAAEACRGAEADRSDAAARKAQAESRVSEARRRVDAEETAETERRAEAERRVREVARAAAEASHDRPGRERSQAALEKVLDHLGSAHHRPFSRA